MGMATAFVSSGFARAGIAGFVCIALTLSLQMGCDRPSNMPSVPALPPNDTPEGKLARIMQRLDSAIETAQASPGSGVISERRAYHKFIPAEGDAALPEAVVFIETKRALAPMALNAAAQAKLKAEAEKQGEDLREEAQKPLIVADDEQTEVDQYPLIYDGQHWKLAKELDPPSDEEPLSMEKILFDYALGAN